MQQTISERTCNYSEIRLSALRYTTRSILSQKLNGTKVIPSPSNLPRDWRGLAHLAGVTPPHANSADPTAAVLSAWEKHENATVQKLIDSLKEIDRWDIVDDTSDLIDKDVSEYLKNLQAREICQVNNEEGDYDVLTTDDVNSNQLQYYDAFLLFDDSDKEFALRVLQTLESTEYGLKLCCKDRLLGGITFEHEAIMRLIRDRCRRLIAIVSPLFLESSANKFLLTFAQALGIEQRQRKIIPCVYSKFVYPSNYFIMQYYFVLDYTRSSPLWNFWDRLSQSIRPMASEQKSLPPAESQSSGVQIQEMKSNCSTPLEVKDWECQKPQEPETASASPTSVPSSSLMSKPDSTPSSNDPGVSKQNKSSASKAESNSSTVESLNGYSESEPMLRSRTSSTASLLSRVFTPKKIIPKLFYRKKKKVSVAV